MDSYNNLLERIDSLYSANLTKERERLQAEYKALVAQINPHFLFNTLDTIRAMSLLYEEENITKAIKALESILKYCLFRENDLVKLRDEINCVKNYVLIYKYRFGKNIEVYYDVQPDIQECLVNRFILQPFIENSIRHGFSDTTKQKIIFVTANKELSNLIIRISDNGDGIEPEILAEINKELEKENGENPEINIDGMGIGIVNVSNRIKFNFGNQYGISIESQPNVGTNVIITLPFNLGI